MKDVKALIKAVLVDIDNTILDFDAYVKQAMRDGFQKFSLGQYENYMDAVFWRINTAMWRDIEDGRITYQELLKTRWNKVFAELGISFDGGVFEKYFKDCLFDSAIPIDGAYHMLEYLKDKYTLCVASNGPYAQQVNRLKMANMLGYFKHLFISESIGASKPSREFFEYCMTELNKEGNEVVLPEEVMIIGDSLSSDIKGALDYGIKACFFDKKKSGKGDLMPIEWVITDLSEIKTIL